MDDLRGTEEDYVPGPECCDWCENEKRIQD